MKKLLLTAFSFTMLSAAIAQVPNNSFENWKVDTSKLDFTVGSFVLKDTFAFEDPIDWTSVNYITGSDSFSGSTPGGVIMATKTTDANTGTNALQIETKSIEISLAAGLPITVPGFVLSGEFEISFSNLTGGGGFNPTSLPGSGIPVPGRLDSFSVFANYTPAVGDSALLLAVLRTGTTIVATAAKFITDTTNGYQRFSVPFVYSSCVAPDSITYAFASSNLFALQDLSSLLASSLLPGSVLLVDDVDYNVAPGNYVLNPIANEDDTSTFKNIPLTVNVLANDVDCDGTATLSLGTISTTTAHGTATKSGSNITYTPDNNYVGPDSVFYELVSTTGKTGNGLLIINVKDVSGIKDVNLVSVKAFPNPTSSTLNIVAALENATVNVFDLAGRVVATETNFNKNVALNIASLSNGTYIINLMDEQGAIVGKTKFAVAK